MTMTAGRPGREGLSAWLEFGGRGHHWGIMLTWSVRAVAECLPGRPEMLLSDGTARYGTGHRAMARGDDPLEIIGERLVIHYEGRRHVYVIREWRPGLTWGGMYLARWPD